MSGKLILFHDAAREKISAGVNTLANAVKITLEPKSRNVILRPAFGALSRAGTPRCNNSRGNSCGWDDAIRDQMPFLRTLTLSPV
ncbi:MAG: hypothetical protein WCD07_12085 [Burkholderiales bacterium]